MTILRDDVLVESSLASSPEPARAIAPDQIPDDRIAVRSPADADTFVDGGWWPRSLDLIAELPQLLAAVEAGGHGEIRRVSYALTAWDGRPPRRATMLNRVIKLGGFRAQNPAEINLVDASGRRRITLVVVPPETEPAIAHRALATAGMDHDRHRAREILDLAQQSGTAHSMRAGCVDGLAAANWESEGGRAAP